MDLRQTYRKMSLPVKATIWFTICNFVLKGISFITGPIFTRLLPPDEYGTLSVFLSYEQLIAIFATWSIQLGAYQKGIFKYADDVDDFTMSAQALTNVMTICCFAFIFPFHKLATRITGMPLIILVLLFFYLLARPAYDCWLARKRKAYDYKAGATVTLLFSIVNILLPMAAIFLIGKTANVKFGFTLIGSAVMGLFFFIPNAYYWKIPKQWEKIKGYWKFCLVFSAPLVLHSLSFLILSQADRVMIKEMMGSSQAAFYSVAYSIASVVSLFQTSVNTTLAPWRYQMLEEKKYDAISGVTKKLLIAFGAMIVMFILVVPEMMKLLFTKDYYEAVWCIPPISAGVFFMFLYSIFVNVEEYYEQTKYVVYVSVTCGIVNIILNYFCIGWFGYVACAYTTLFSYILFAVGHYVFMKKTLKQAGISENVVDGKHILLVSTAVLGMSILVTVLYNNVLLRYGLLVGILLAAYVKRKTIMEVLSMMKQK